MIDKRTENVRESATSLTAALISDIAWIPMIPLMARFVMLPLERPSADVLQHEIRMIASEKVANDLLANRRERVLHQVSCPTLQQRVLELHRWRLRKKKQISNRATHIFGNQTPVARVLRMGECHDDHVAGV